MFKLKGTSEIIITNVEDKKTKAKMYGLPGVSEPRLTSRAGPGLFASPGRMEAMPKQLNG